MHQIKAEQQKARHQRWRAFRVPKKVRLRRSGRSGRRREGVGRAAVAALIRDDNGNGGHNSCGAGADDQRTIADLLRGLDTRRLARNQGMISGESRRTNHRCHRHRGNNILKTVHRLPPLSNGGILVRSHKPSQPAFPISFLTVAKRLYRIGRAFFCPILAHQNRAFIGLGEDLSVQGFLPRAIQAMLHMRNIRTQALLRAAGAYRFAGPREPVKGHT